MNSGFNPDYDDVKAQAAAEALRNRVFMEAVFASLQSTQNPMGFEILMRPFDEKAPRFRINAGTSGCERGLFEAANFPWQGENEKEGNMTADDCVMWAKRWKETRE